MYNEMLGENNFENTKEQNLEKEEKMDRVAKNMIDSFSWNSAKESFLLITDDEVVRENKELIDALENELKKRTDQDKRTKGNYKIMVAKSSPVSATPFGETIGREMHDRPILILTSMSRSHSKETGVAGRGDIGPKNRFTDTLLSMGEKNINFGSGRLAHDIINKDIYYDKLQKIAKEKRARIMSCTKGTNPFEILTEGAAEEAPGILRERAKKITELMKDVDSVHIATEDGTDLTLKIRTDKTEIETGDLSRPGSLGNYPVGEWACSPWWQGANGTLVVDGPFGGKNKESGRWHNLDWVKEDGPFKLTVQEGEIVQINGYNVSEQRKKPDNKLIASFIEYLDSGNNSQNDAYKLAEFALGINSKACKNKSADKWGSTETEKLYGTCHIAVGSNGSLGIDKGDSNYNAANVHCDMIILDPNLNIECIKKDGKKFVLIDQGKPQGY